MRRERNYRKHYLTYLYQNFDLLTRIRKVNTLLEPILLIRWFTNGWEKSPLKKFEKKIAISIKNEIYLILTIIIKKKLYNFITFTQLLHKSSQDTNQCLFLYLKLHFHFQKIKGDIHNLTTIVSNSILKYGIITQHLGKTSSFPYILCILTPLLLPRINRINVSTSFLTVSS